MKRHLDSAAIERPRDKDTTEVSWKQLGFCRIRGLFTAQECETLTTHCAGIGDAGVRDLLEQGWCRELAAELRSRLAASHLLPAHYVAVQCSVFQKSTSINWIVALHQDLSVPVAARVDATELTGWSIKDGAHYVQPPPEFLAQLIAVRLHLDECGESDGPLAVVPGSHRHGRVTADGAALLRGRQGLHVCVAERGDALLLCPLLHHPSSKATGESRRRVLHVLFAPVDAPCGLRWCIAV